MVGNICRRRVEIGSVDIGTRVGWLLWDKPGGYLFTARVVSGVQAAGARTRLSYGTCEGVAPELPPGVAARGRRPGGGNREGLSTGRGARWRTGPWELRNLVMRAEPRGRVALAEECGQPEGMNRMTEPMLQGARHSETARVGCVAEGEGEQGSGRGRRRDDRAGRGWPAGQPVQKIGREG